jgi:hypothetical protein
VADNIKTFSDNVGTVHADGAGAAAYEQLGRHVEANYSTAGRAIGAGIEHVQADIKQHDEMSDAASLANGFADLDMKTSQNLSDAKNTMDPHDPDGVQKFMAQHQQALDDLEGNLSTDKGKEMFTRMSANYRTSTFNKYLGDQSNAAAGDIVSKYNGAAKTLSNMAQQDPTNVGTASAQLEISSEALPVEHRAAYLSQAKQGLYDSAGEGMVNRIASNPNVTADQVDAAKAFINDKANGYVDNMSEGQFAAVNAKFDRIKDTQGNVQSVIAAQTLSSGFEQLKGNGGNDPGNQWQTIIDSYKGKSPEATQVWKAEAQRKYDAAISFGQAAKSVNGTPDDAVDAQIADVSAKLDTAKPEEMASLEAKQKAMVEAQAQRDKAFHADQAGWTVENNDVVQQRFAAYQANPGPQTFAQYAQTSAAEQQRLFPNDAPKLLSHDMNDHIGAAVSGITSGPEGAQQAATILSSYAQIGGKYWPQLSQELFQAKTLNANQFVASSLYAKPGASALAAELLRASVVAPKDLVGMNAGKEDMTAEKARAAANDAFAPLARTAIDGRDRVSVVGGYEEALSTLLQFRGNIGDAKDLAKKMINDEYSFTTTLRIPKAAQVNTDDVTAGLQSSLGRVTDASSGINGANLIIPKSFSGLGPNDQKRAYVANIQARGRWVTNSDESGAVLHDENGNAVWQAGKDGKPQLVGVSWADAAKAGSDARGLTGKAYKFVAGQ